jgi:hypothetical protein
MSHHNSEITQTAVSSAVEKGRLKPVPCRSTFQPSLASPRKGGQPAGHLLRKAIVLMTLVWWVNGGVAAGSLITTTNDFITGVSIFEVSSQNADRAAVNIINGNGLNSTTLEHDTGLNSKLWQTLTGDLTPSITFDLGAQYSLGLLRVWNYNSADPNNRRGLKDVEIWVSSDTNAANLVLAQTLSFAIAPGLTTYLGEEILLSDFAGYADVRLIQLNTLSNHGDTFVSGLSEIRFSTVPEPSVYGLLALAATGLGVHVFRRRRSV